MHVIIERKNEELIEIIKEQRLVMEEKDRELEQSQTQLKLIVEKNNDFQNEARNKLKTELKKEEETMASAIEELQHRSEAQDDSVKQMRKDLQKKDELQDEVVGQLATGLQSHLEDFGNSTMARKSVVGFTARLTNYMRYSNGQRVVFDNIGSNVGGSYNPETGIFSAPASGLYIFSMTIFTHKHWVFVTMRKNDVVIGRVHPDGRDASDPYETASNTVVVDLEKGDNVYLRFENSVGSWSSDLHNGYYNTFSGAYIA